MFSSLIVYTLILFVLYLFLNKESLEQFIPAMIHFWPKVLYQFQQIFFLDFKFAQIVSHFWSKVCQFQQIFFLTFEFAWIVSLLFLYRKYTYMQGLEVELISKWVAWR